MFETDLQAIRQCVQRNAPFGSQPWVLQTASTLGLQSSLRQRGNLHLDVHFVSLTPVPIVTGQGLTTPEMVKDLRNGHLG